jgi:outer membrane protein assembly factor BamD (BamD/ComL family)
VAAYQQFLSNHPTGQHSVDAADRIRALQDEQAWAQAKQANTAEGYRDYLQKQPAGTHVKEAQEAVTAAQRAADWTEAQSKGTVAAIQDFLGKYPGGTEADQARAKLSALSGYKVELASAKTQKRAEKEREHLRTQYGNILHDVVVVPDNSGKSYRLESAPMSKTQADSACSQLKKAHQSCKVIENGAGKS